MQSSLENQIEEERRLIAALDAKLDSNRTPVYEERLLFASHLLDGAVSCGNAAFAADCLQRAILKRMEVDCDPRHSESAAVTLVGVNLASHPQAAVCDGILGKSHPVAGSDDFLGTFPSSR